MNNYAVMPKDDYVAACNAIREKTGDTEAIKSGELVNKVSEVHDAGAVSILQSSKYMYPTVSGEAIQIDDMADVSFKARVMKRSKNLLTAQQVYSGTYLYAEEVLDGRNCVRTTSGNTLYKYLDIFKPNTQYTVSFYEKSVNYGDAKGPNIIFAFKYTDGTYEYKYAKQDSNNNHNTDWAYLSFTSAVGKTVAAIGVGSGQYLIYTYVDIDTFQFEEGTTATAYTPHIEDLAAVKVYKSGKNLLDINSYTIIGNPTYKIEGDSLKATCTWGDCIGYTITNLTPFAIYRFSYKANNATSGLIYYLDAKGALNVHYSASITLQADATGSITVYFRNSLAANREYDICDIQLEIGDTQTKYEPYEEFVEVGAKFESTPSVVTLIHDTSGVILDCQYCRDIDKYIDSLNVAVAMTGGV